MAESQNLANVVQEKDRNIAELQNRIRILEEQMKLARQQRFGKKCESLYWDAAFPVRRGC
ncbi:hypothetical protein O5171_23965 [Escherichia coli]|nr:hypothetical protein [Escherichia coli]